MTTKEIALRTPYTGYYSNITYKYFFQYVGVKVLFYNDVRSWNNIEIFKEFFTMSKFTTNKAKISSFSQSFEFIVNLFGHFWSVIAQKCICLVIK